MSLRKLLFFVVAIGVLGAGYQKLWKRPLSHQELAIQLPVHFYSFSYLPIVKVKIQGIECRLKVDLGAAKAFSLGKNVLEKLESKEFKETRHFFGASGKIYESPCYAIPPFSIDCLELSDVTIVEDHPEFLKQATIWPTEEISKRKKRALSMLHGTVGRDVFQLGKCLFDFPHRRIYFSQGWKFYRKNHLVDGFLEIPFFHEEVGVVLLVDTDLGPKRLFLDTGASHSILKLDEATPWEVHWERRFARTKRFVMGGQDYGQMLFAGAEIPKAFGDIDGILGLDFLRKHAFLLDFEEKKIYMQPPRKSLTRRLFQGPRQLYF